MKDKTKVIAVKNSPVALGNGLIREPDIVSGIRDAAAAREWGERKGYGLVYFQASKQRAYAEKMSARVDEQATGTAQ